MGKPWDAELRVGPELAQRLIRAQAPLVAAERVEILGEGWDNIVYLVDHEWVVRFPRHELGADLLHVEASVLPRIAAGLPLPVPVPMLFGRPSSEFPMPFVGYRHLPGRSAGWAQGADARGRMAGRLGRFLAALHALPTSELIARGLPAHTIDRRDLRVRVPKIRERLKLLAQWGLVETLDPWLSLCADLPRRPRASCLVHGDFYAPHFLVDDLEELCGIIDWGYVHRGDPACDLMVAFGFLPTDVRSAFWEAYGETDPETKARAQFWALHHGVILTWWGHSVGDNDRKNEGLWSLRLLRSSI